MRENRLVNKLVASMDGKNYATQLQGQAAVWAVASELAIRGHVPYFPGVDFGHDLVLDNGLRLQIKSSRLRYHPGYPDGAYCFSFRQSYAALGKNKTKDRSLRDYTKVADFFVLWGVDEKRFWIIPCEFGKRSVWFGRARSETPWLDVNKMREMRDSGMTQDQIAEALGTNQAVVSRNLRNEAHLYDKFSQRRLKLFEDRWDLLNIDRTVESTLVGDGIVKVSGLVPASVGSVVAPE